MRARLAGVIVVAVLAAVTACSGTDTGQGATQAPAGTPSPPGGPATSAPPATSAAPGGTANRVEVSENEFSISLTRREFTPGTYTFVVDNAGKANHDLSIKGPGVDGSKTAVLASGSEGEVTVTLQPGTYELWCTVGNHRDRGMTTTITVSG